MRDPLRSQIDAFITLPIACLVIFIDRITKIYFSDLLRLHESLPVINNILHMTLVHNTGIAFGLLKDQSFVFFIIPVVAFILLFFNIYYYKQNDQALSRSYLIAFALILGGAIGNLYDRMTLGYVIDFIDFRIWPVFNIADSAITIGAVIIAVKCFRLSHKE